MIMHHKDSNEPIDVHPSQVENMKTLGWEIKSDKKVKQTGGQNGNTHG